MALRAAVRSFREGTAPAAIVRCGRPHAPSNRGGRSFSSLASGTPSCSCESQILQFRKEMLAENRRVWMMYEGLLDVNHKMLVKMTEIEAKSVEREVLAMATNVKSSYNILASGGAFMMGMFLVVGPLLKDSWQQDTIEAMEKKMTLKRANQMIRARTPQGKDCGPTAADGCACDKANNGDIVTEQDTDVAKGNASSASTKATNGGTSADGKPAKGGASAPVSTKGSGGPSADGKQANGDESAPGPKND